MIKFMLSLLNHYLQDGIKSKQQYVAVSEQNRNYLLTELKRVQQQYHLPVIVIDYLPSGERKEAQIIAKKIQALDMIPWIADGQLETMGVGSVTPIPRKIFILYTPDKINPTIFTPPVFQLLAMPLEYLGYLPEYHDAEQPLPANVSTDEYAGIVVWVSLKQVQQQKALYQWLLKRLNDHIPILFMVSFGFDPTEEVMSPFGLVFATQSKYPNKIHISKKDNRMLGFEIEPYPSRFDFLPVKANNSEVLLQLTDDKGNKEDAIAITPWGGYALDPYVAIEMPNAQNFWVLNPFEWLSRVLRLQTLPIPDITTENGRRLMFAHIDGDGFVSSAEWRGSGIAAVEIEDKILKRYQIPTTVSVIVADIAPFGLYPSLSKEMVAEARHIFKLPWVEIASHTFSHPFNWLLMLKQKTSGKYNLPVKNYLFNPVEEIEGSVNYINEYLAPKGKKCKILLWSGSANPNEQELSLVFKANVANLNGGDTHIVRTFPAISNVSPIGRRQGEYYQVFAPITNEEYYTNYWEGPFYGFERVIDTLKLTDSPRRLKPLDIYYHFYSGTKLASLVALNKVYQWALSQPVMNIFASEYVEKAIDANTTTSIARYNDGWQIKTKGAVRELRIPDTLGYPDLLRSENVVGFNHYNNVYYVHLGIATQSTLFITKNKPTLPYLSDANASIIAFNRDKNSMILKLKGYLPLQWKLANSMNCVVVHDRDVLKGSSDANHMMQFTLSRNESNDIRIECK